MGHNNKTNSPQRRPRCWGLFRRRFNNFSEQVSCDVRSYQQQDGDPAKSHAHLDTCIRYTPYAIPSRQQRGSFYKRDQGENMKGEQKSLESAIEKRQDRSMANWFKIIIPFGIKYDEKWLLSLIQKECSIPFTPVRFQYEKMQAQFFVENASAAFALKNVNGKIWDKDNEKISIFVSPSDAPYSVQKQLKSGNSEQRKLPMNKLRGASLPPPSLGIRRCCVDPDLMAQDTAMALKPRNGMAASLQIHEENVPSLLPLNLSKKKPYQLSDTTDVIQNVSSIKTLNPSKSEVNSAGELDRDKGLKLQDMSAERESLCTTFPDKSSNMSSVLELFPKLLRLDSLSPSNFSMQAQKLPTSKGSSFGSNALKDLVLEFLQQYFWIYDYGNRQGLLGAYHEQACFSLSIPFNPKDPAPSLWQYFKDSRNMIKLKDPYVRYQLLRHTNLDIVSTLCVLPQTQHDLGSFLVDLWVHTESMLCFSVHGVFKEVVGRSPFSVRAFTRTFITVPGSNSSLCIVNDELFVRDPLYNDSQNGLFTPLPTPTCSLGRIPLQEQQEMAQTFTAQCGMKLEWPQKCPQDNGWNDVRAAPVLAQPKAQGKIPEATLTQLYPGP